MATSDIDKEAFDRIRLLRITGPKRSLIRDLRFMAQYKYDSYEMYSPVKRFLPTLLEWLNQFETPSQRETALHIVRQLLFLSRREILELSHSVYQKILHELLGEIIRKRGLNQFDYSRAYRELKRFAKTKCVFIGMSDGAQIDHFRRHSNGMIENDQVVPYYKIDRDEIKKLSRAKYAFLIDDVCLSGTTFLGEEREGEEAKMGGQLARFIQKWKDVQFETIYYCPYVTTEKALRRLQTVPRLGLTSLPSGKKIGFRIIYGMSIPKEYSMLSENNQLFNNDIRRRVVRLCREYYDFRVENAATMKGGGTMFGFGKVGVFLVRYNNTPNDTPSIIWNPIAGKRSLFRRLVRHYK